MKIEERLVLKKQVKRFISKLLCTILILLIGLILSKSNTSIKNTLEDIIYNKTFKFASPRKFYKKYFGNFLIPTNTKKEERVFNEKLSYSAAEKYKDGVRLRVSNNYLVPVLESGIVVYVGEKDNIKTIILEQVNGIDIYYKNINIGNYKLYDYIEKGQVLGEVRGTNLYLSFYKDGKKEDYKKYI